MAEKGSTKFVIKLRYLDLVAHAIASRLNTRSDTANAVSWSATAAAVSWFATATAVSSSATAIAVS